MDVIATPTAMFTPLVLTEMARKECWAHNRNIVHNLAPVNYLGLCAATLPVGLDRLGMPVGLQFISKGGDDERLLAVACAAERVVGHTARNSGCAADMQDLASGAGALAIAGR